MCSLRRTSPEQPPTNYDSYYDSIAHQYDALRLDGGPELAATLSSILNHLPVAPEPILDVGCGTGRYAQHLAQRNLSVIGVDRSRAQLAQCSSIVSKVCAMVERMPLGNSTIGMCMMVMMLHQLSSASRRQAIFECRRVTRPGGTIFIKTRSREDLKKRFINQYLPSTLQLNLQRYPSIETLIAELEAEGFTNIQVKPTETEIILPVEELLDRITQRHNTTLYLVPPAELDHALIKLRADLVGTTSVRQKLHHTIVTATTW